MDSSQNTFKARPKNLPHGFRPIYYFSRCIGLWPFKIYYDSNGSIKGTYVSLFDKFWFFISICLHLAASFFTYEDSQSTRDPHLLYYFPKLIYNLTAIPDFLFGVLCIILEMFNRNRLVNILKQIIFFDRKVSFQTWRNKNDEVCECDSQKWVLSIKW